MHKRGLSLTQKYLVLISKSVQRRQLMNIYSVLNRLQSAAQYALYGLEVAVSTTILSTLKISFTRHQINLR